MTSPFASMRWATGRRSSAPARATRCAWSRSAIPSTFGHGVEGEEAWPRALEPVLATRTSRPVEVINAGVDGRWMDEYYLELKDRTLALDPDVVLLGFFIGNDIDGEDARTHDWSAVDARGRPLRIDAPDRCVDRGYRVQCVPQLRWRFPIIRNSHVAQLLFGAGESHRRVVDAAAGPSGRDLCAAVRARDAAGRRARRGSLRGDERVVSRRMGRAFSW